MTEHSKSAEALLASAADKDLASWCERLRTTLDAATAQRRAAASVVAADWLGPNRDLFDQAMTRLDGDSADLAARLTALIARLSAPR